jgi:crotonobetainyl-CoA:carnitine CoA-transferase CaiB-like acyl-CoA transferase
MTRPQGPLVGARILELTGGIAGGAAGMLLADLGAEVVRVVSPGEPRRPWDPAQLCRDRGKLLATLDRSKVGAATELRRLVDAADVVLTDVRPGELERGGLDAATLLHRDHRLVHAWLPPYAVRGRWSQLPDDPLLLAAIGGFADHHPAAEDRPVAPVVPTVAYVHGALGAAAIAAALVGREATGTGRALAVTGLHASAAILAPMMVQGLDVSEVFSPGKSLPGAPHYRMYQAADGRWLYLAALTPEFFFRALDALDRMDVLARPDVGGEFSNFLVPAIGAAVGAQLEESFGTRPCEEWLTLFAEAGVPVAPVSSRTEWMASEIVAANRARLEFEHPELGAVTMPGIPVTLSSTPGAVRHLPGNDHVVPAKAVWRDVDERARSATPAIAPSGLPLAGLRVVDLCTFLAGPFASAVLADHGADVIKVEPVTGDPYRVYTVSYVVVNQRKRAVALDLRHPDGRAALIDLVRHADVLIDNLRPASLDRLGLGEQVLANANPRLVRASVSAYGHGGPWADLPGFDPVMQALSGLATAQGGIGDPVPTTAPVHDVGTGSVAAFAILAALYARATTIGTGQRVTTSLAAVSTLLQSAELTTFAGRPPTSEGGADFPGPSAGHRYYRTSDGWLAVAATTPSQLLDLLHVVGDPDWAALDDAELARRLGNALANRPVIEWVDELAARDVPACQVLERTGELDDPFLVDNVFSHVVREPVLGRLRVVRSYTDWLTADRPPPASGAPVGRDTRAVLEEVGMAPEHIERIVTNGAAIAPAQAL